MKIGTLRRRSRLTRRLMIILTVAVLSWLSAVSAAPSQAANGAFDQVTAHVRRQIATDKLYFAEADRCTNWFYRRQRLPSIPTATGVSRRLSDEEATCRTKYPKGLEEARADFARTQSTLSLSLTFFELLLVSDRNDDLRYSATELSDLLDALDVLDSGTAPLLLPEAQVTALVARFDAAHGANNLELVMRSLTTLFDKGYRFTPEDQAVLRGVSG